MQITSIKKDLSDLFPKPLLRGVFLTLIITIAAKFLADHYSAPATLFALLFGLGVNFLSSNEKCLHGVTYCEKTLLKGGVVLLGFNLAVVESSVFNINSIIVVISITIITILFGLVLCLLLGKSRSFGILSGGAVAICGVSAALAISSSLPQRKSKDAELRVVIVGVTLLSTLAMIIYPIIFSKFGLNDYEIGFLLGATIHDVAQVIGAGYSVGDDAGLTATIVKMIRVSFLPAILILLLLVNKKQSMPINFKAVQFPFFIIGFIICAILGKSGILPNFIYEFFIATSSWLILIAITAIGIKTNIPQVFELSMTYGLILVIITIFIVAIGLLSIQFSLF